LNSFFALTLVRLFLFFARFLVFCESQSKEENVEQHFSASSLLLYLFLSTLISYQRFLYPCGCCLRSLGKLFCLHAQQRALTARPKFEATRVDFTSFASDAWLFSKHEVN